MEDRKLFQIGDVAKMFHLSPGSLRHYEQAGLLQPEYVDEETGYRYYSVRQFEVLNTIRYLRALDMPIAQIEDFLKNREIDVIEDKLLKQKELIAKKQRELATIERKIDHRLEQLKDALHSELDVIRLKKMPACRIVWVKDSLRPKSYLDLEYAIRKLAQDQEESMIFLGKVGIGLSKEKLLKREFEPYDSIFLILDEEDHYEGEIEQHPEEMCACVRFRGSHNEAADQYRKLMNYLEEQKLEVTGFSREITMIDYGITSNTDKFVTEISIPVRAMRNGD